MTKKTTNNPNGRPVGSKNRISTDAKALAGRYVKMAIEQLANIAQKSNNETNRLAAIEQILNRACGKPAQAVVGDQDQPVALRITWMQ